MQKTLIADDVAYWKSHAGLAEARRPAAQRSRRRTEHGCPYDCGLCPDHEQHSLPGDRRDQRGLQPHLPGLLRRRLVRASAAHRPLAEIEAMLDVLVDARASRTWCSSPAASRPSTPSSSRSSPRRRRRPIRHLMINTNGLRIAREAGFAERAGRLHAGLRGLPAVRQPEREALMELRGADLARVRQRGAGGAEARTSRPPWSDGEEGRQRRRDRRHRPPRPGLVAACAASPSSRSRTPAAMKASTQRATASC